MRQMRYAMRDAGAYEPAVGLARYDFFQEEPATMERTTDHHQPGNESSTRGNAGSSDAAIAPEAANVSEAAIVKDSFADQVYEHVKRLILSGKLRQGERIVEDQIAKQFGLSRTPVRHAIVRLAEYGLVYVRPRSYAEVARLEIADVRQIAAVRFHLEKLIFSEFMQRATADDVSALTRIAQYAEKVLLDDDTAEYFETDSNFHLEVARRCGNPHLCQIVERFDVKTQLLRVSQRLSPRQLVPYMRQHYQLLELVQRHDEQALHRDLHRHIIHDLEQ